MLECLKATQVPGKSGFERINDALTDFREGLAQQDDITLAELTCDPVILCSEADASRAMIESRSPATWKLSMEFSALMLKEIDPVPAIVQTLMDIQGLQVHCDPIFIIVSELFTGALEYGLLGLDPKMKISADRTIKYFEIREKRLKALEKGAIKVSISHKPAASGGRMTLRIQDTGVVGWFKSAMLEFDGKKKSTDQGLGMLNRICQSVEFLEHGNYIKAVYQWDR